MKTDKIILRKFNINDAGKMFENWASDSKVTKFLSWNPHTKVSESENIIKQWINDDKNINFAICNTNDENIGSIAARLIKENPKTYNIGYCLGYDYWSQGIMTECLKLVLKYLFEEKLAVRVEATHDRRNPASGKVMVNSNMKYEGCLRKSATNNQGVADSCMYSMIDEDYECDFVIPEFDEMNFRQELLADEKTMSFNEKYGGAIDFSEDKWQSWYDKWINSEDRFYYYIMGHNKPVGECCIYKEDDRWICSLIVKDEYRNNGYGKRALMFLIDLAKKLDIDELYDNIGTCNPSLNLFLKCGFEVVYTIEEYSTVRIKTR